MPVNCTFMARISCNEDQQIWASIKFLKGAPRRYNREVIMTEPGRAMEALKGEAGTRIVLESNRESSA